MASDNTSGNMRNPPPKKNILTLLENNSKTTRKEMTLLKATPPLHKLIRKISDYINHLENTRTHRNFLRASVCSQNKMILLKKLHPQKNPNHLAKDLKSPSK